MKGVVQVTLPPCMTVDAYLQAEISSRKMYLPSFPLFNVLIDAGRYWHGRDKLGHPIVYIRTRSFDPKKRDLKQAQRLVVHVFESCITAMHNGCNNGATDSNSSSGGGSISNPVSKFCLIWDQYAAQSANIDSELFRFISKVLLTHYPGRSCCFCSCAPHIRWWSNKPKSLYAGCT